MGYKTRKQIAVWLLVCCTLLFVLIVVGGVTRLTRSGLSIVEWQPIIGALPPLNETQWLELLEKYKQTPEYKQVNLGMSLEAFKEIFWWEYLHRLLGRLLGLVYLVPMLWFVGRKLVGRELAVKLATIFILGALQGVMGWLMVKSGLIDNPRVSHFRLTAHLGLAFLIFGSMFWVALDLLRSADATCGAIRDPTRRHRALARVALALVWVVFTMVLSGGLVAGIRAGSAYNTFPLMNGHLVPPEIFMIEPWYLNFFNNMATVQFDHRLLAWLLAFCVSTLWIASRASDTSQAVRMAANCLLASLALQIILGIATLLFRVPIVLAASHQAGAVLVFASVLSLAHVLRK